jgi:4-hydroxy-tetrahydrodipicolinate synthase
VELFNDAINGQRERALPLYHWFLPLLRLDTLPNFVQLIKLVQAHCGVGSPRVRPPRLELAGQELKEAQRLIDDALRHRPQAVASQAMAMVK